MIKRKPFIIIILLTILIAVLLSACNAGTSSEPTDTESTPTLSLQVETMEPGQLSAPEKSEESEEEPTTEGEIALPETLPEELPERTPEPTATPGLISEQVSSFTAETGLDDTTILGLTVDDWINLAISAILVLVSYFFGTWLVHALARWVNNYTSSEIGNTLVASIGTYMKWLVVLWTLQFSSNRLVFLTAELKEFLGDIYFIAAWVLLIRITWRLISFGVEQATERTKKDGREEQLAPVIHLAALTVRAVAALFFIGILLAHFGFNLTWFIAALGIGGLALSLALKDTLANAISGLIILVDQPFRVGDRIEVPNLGTWADVVEISLRTTKVVTRDNRTVIFPNALVSNAEIVNYSYPDPSYRLQTDVGVAYGTDIETTKNVLYETVRRVEGVYLDKPVDVFYNEMGDSAMLFRVRWWLETYSDKRPVIDRVNIAIQQALDTEGIESPFPTQSLIHQLDQQTVEQLKQTSHESDQPTSQSGDPPLEASRFVWDANPPILDHPLMPGRLPNTMTST